MTIYTEMREKERKKEKEREKERERERERERETGSNIYRIRQLKKAISHNICSVIWLMQ
jgi:hypothetical protein